MKKLIGLWYIFYYHKFNLKNIYYFLLMYNKKSVVNRVKMWYLDKDELPRINQVTETNFTCVQLMSKLNGGSGVYEYLIPNDTLNPMSSKQALAKCRRILKYFSRGRN